MFVRFRQGARRLQLGARRLQLSLVETRRDGGKVRHEHVMKNIGAAETHLRRCCWSRAMWWKRKRCIATIWA